MNHTYFFQYNVPANNQPWESTNVYINVLTQWGGNTDNKGNAIGIYVDPVNLSRYNLRSVKDWAAALEDIDAIAQKHYDEIAYQQRIKEANEFISNAKIIGNISVNENGIASPVN